MSSTYTAVVIQLFSVRVDFITVNTKNATHRALTLGQVDDQINPFGSLHFVLVSFRLLFFASFVRGGNKRNTRTDIRTQTPTTTRMTTQLVDHFVVVGHPPTDAVGCLIADRQFSTGTSCVWHTAVRVVCASVCAYWCVCA